MNIQGERLSTLEQLCRSSIKASIAKLSQIGTWPRPPAARRLRVGYDFGRNDLQDIQEVNNLIQYLASDNQIKSIYFGQSSTPELWILYEFWERLLLNILRETEGMSPNNRVFHKWFKKFVKELYSDTAVWRTIDTVTGLNFREKTLRLDDITSLTSTPGYDLRILIGKQELDLLDFHGGSPGGFDKATIITTVRIPKQQHAGFTHPYPHLLKDIERSNALIEAIRLTKTGVPRLHCHIMVHLSDFPLCEPFAYCRSEGDIGMYEKKAIVERSDLQSIRNLWRELMDSKYKDSWPKRSKLSVMDMALARFSRTYGRQNWLDDIVDLTIALESLFSPKDNQELSHRISLRAAWLLSFDERADEDSGKVKNKIYECVRTMYDIRSFRVHGGIPKKRDIRKWVQTLSGVQYDESKYSELLEVALESARDIVRKAIRACMILGKLETDGPHWPFPKNFDQNIVIAGQRRVWQKAAGIRSKR